MFSHVLLVFFATLSVAYALKGASRSVLVRVKSEGSLNSNAHSGTEVATLRKLLINIDNFLESRSTDLFGYADCTNLGPNAERSVLGILFLATNLPYLLVGVQLMGDRPEYNLLNAAGVISFVYHYLQLKLGPGRIEVRRALFVDYTTAIQASFIYGLDCLELLVNLRDPATGQLSTTSALPFVAGAIALLCLWRSAVVDSNGKKYIFWHGLWHLFGAYVQKFGLYYLSSLPSLDTLRSPPF